MTNPTTKTCKGRAIALSTVALGVVVLVAAGIVSKDRILEKWYLYQLDTGGPEAKEQALEILARVGSEESYLRMIEYVRGDVPVTGNPSPLATRKMLGCLKAVQEIGIRIGNSRKRAAMLWYMKDPRAQERTRVAFAGTVIRTVTPREVLLSRGPPVLFWEPPPSDQEVREFTKAKPAAIEVLTQALASEDRLCQREAAFRLSLCGPEAAAAVPALKAVLGDTDELVSKPAAEALKKIQGKQDEK